MFDLLRRRGGPGESAAMRVPLARWTANGQLTMTSTAVKVRGWKCMEVNLVREHVRSRMIRGYSTRPGQRDRKRKLRRQSGPCAPVSADISPPTWRVCPSGGMSCRPTSIYDLVIMELAPALSRLRRWLRTFGRLLLFC